MPTCGNCERPVSLDFARARGVEDGAVESCPRCRE
ncbi:DUF7563 family protein [Natrononativus amylolyticus]